MDFIIFGLSAVVGGVLSRGLPETLNRPLPETVEDVDLWASVPLGTHIVDLSQPEIMERSIRRLEEEFEVLERLKE